MNKKYLSALLFGAVLIASTGTFTSCKDYDDDIQGLQAQVDGLSANIQELQAAAGKYVTSVTYDENTGVLTVVGGTGGTYQLPMPAHVPSYTLEIVGDEIHLLADGSVVSSASLPEVEFPELPNIPEDFNPELLKWGEDGYLYYGDEKIEGVTKQDAFNPELLSWGKDGYLYYGDQKIEGVAKPDAPASITELKDGEDVIGYIIDINGETATFYVTFKLSSISFAPDNFVDGVEAIVFNSLVYADWTKLEETKESLADEKKLSTAALATASYHFNPSTFNLDNATYQFIDREANLISRAGATATDLFTVEEGPVANIEDGTVDFKLRRTNVPTTQPEEKDINIVALQATLDKSILSEAEKGSNVVITSPYVEVYDATCEQEDLFISDAATIKEGANAHYALTVTAAQAEKPRYDVVYDEEFNLAEKVATCLFNDENNTHNVFDTEGYKLSYRFYVAKTSYNVTSAGTTTNQQTVIECVDAEKGLYKVPEKVKKEAIGRTPILKVALVDENERVLRYGYVKVNMVAEKSDDIVAPKEFNLTYECENTPAEDIYLDEEWMRKNVYRKIESSRGDISMSHEEFWNTYVWAESETKITKNGDPFTMSAPQVIDGVPSQGTATKKVVWNFTHGELGIIGTGSVYKATVVLNNKLASSEFPAKVTFELIVNAKLPAVSGEFSEQKIYWDLDANNNPVAFRSNVNRPDDINSPATDCLFETRLGDAFASINVKDAPECVAKYYRVASTSPVGLNGGVIIRGTNADDQIIGLDKTDDNVKKALNSKDGLSAVVEYVVQFESGDVVPLKTFTVSFVRPLQLNMPVGLSVIDAKTGGDVVDFEMNQLLTDWRGYSVYAPDQEIQDVNRPYWNKVCTPHFQLIPGWNEVISPAKWNVEFDIIHVETGINELWGTRGIVTFEWAYTKTTPDGMGTVSGTTTTTQTIEIPAEYMTAADAEAAFSAAMGDPNDYMPTNEQIGLEPGYGATISFNGISSHSLPYSEQVNSVVDVKVIKSMEYVPAVIETHDPVFVPTPCNEKPSYEGTEIGQTVGCWQWTDKVVSETVNVPGAYWNFYGPFGELTLDIDNATTDLENGGKLPSNITLVQDGYTVKYENIGTPVSRIYHITIPASINYGWGTATDNLVIEVNPAAGIAE